MPQMNSAGGDDLASTDEVKVYKDEGEEEEQNKSSENLTEDKVGLVHEGEELSIPGTSFSMKNGFSGMPKFSLADTRFATYLLHTYPSYVNGASPAGFGGKVPLVATAPSPFSSLMSLYVNEAFTHPPPAHMGTGPLDLKTSLHRAGPMYAIPTPPPGQFPPHPLYSPDFSQWQAAAGVAGVGAHGGYASPMRSAYSPASSLMSHPGLAGRFSPTMLAHHGVMPMHAGGGGSVGGVSSHHHSLMSGLAAAVSAGGGSGAGALHHQGAGGHGGGELGMHGGGGGGMYQTHHHHHHQLHDHHRSDLCGPMKMPISEPEKPKKPHIKKPLNAFMLFMKEQRSKVVAECTLKESAAINQILGRKWHALSREDQAKYYEMARKEKELHQQLYPGWSARDNYAVQAKRKKKRKLPHPLHDTDMDGKPDCSIPKKCRARYGLEHQNQWCKPCRRKKKCIRYLSDTEDCEGEIVVGEEEEEEEDGTEADIEVEASDTDFEADVCEEDEEGEGQLGCTTATGSAHTCDDNDEEVDVKCHSPTRLSAVAPCASSKSWVGGAKNDRFPAAFYRPCFNNNYSSKQRDAALFSVKKEAYSDSSPPTPLLITTQNKPDSTQSPVSSPQPSSSSLCCHSDSTATTASPSKCIKLSAPQAAAFSKCSSDSLLQQQQQQQQPTNRLSSSSSNFSSRPSVHSIDAGEPPSSTTSSTTTPLTVT